MLSNFYILLVLCVYFLFFYCFFVFRFFFFFFQAEDGIRDWSVTGVQTCALPIYAYGNPLTGSGTEESVTRMTRDDLVRFHRTWFKPNHATLVVVGDISLAEIQPKQIGRASCRERV